MTRDEIREQIARCDREVLGILSRPPETNELAILTAMGQMDWEWERRLLERELEGR